MTSETPLPVLVVDLDGTLLRSDILFETFWSALGRNWRTPIQAVGALMQSKAKLKRDLAQSGPLDVATLPYDPEVISYVKNWRNRGGRTALVTASDERIANGIFDHLGIFDEVYGSDGVRNLKGPAKASFLKDHFEGGFAYMGDAHADIPVWSQAERAITVNTSASLRSTVDSLDAQVDHLQTRPNSIKPYIKAMRPHQWLKNILVFLPMLAAHQYDWGTFLAALMAFISFSMVASSAYVTNDLLDLAADRAHPRKCKRPFASGAIPIAHGTWMAMGMLALGVIIAASVNLALLGAMIFYYVATTAYSLNIKRRIVIDIIVLAGLYTTRIIAGGYATEIPLSVWLLAFSVFFFLSLASVKRQAELIDTAKRGAMEAAGRGYQVDDLPLISQVAISSGYVSVLVMALYINSPTVVELYRSPTALWVVCLILLYWLTRIIMITHRGHMHDDPVVFAAKDRTSQLCFLGILFCAIWGALL
ncbi:UbiA family prenyltransferase [Ruegeria conchae]|uniref:4-hydroxybenzoate polyprenyltransferase n=1 Tax=Ruegeria conchae TaxID=981384 RepID=A0A497ZFI7_9RHOB|nr:UbiA family prenyltransferase [Ruegeria conchae]RLK07331.1 4-hydroxybenzoate polyprenyltransferase [Ruegeria conchae]